MKRFIGLGFGLLATVALGQEHSSDARRRQGLVSNPYAGESRSMSGGGELFAKAPSPYANLIDQSSLEVNGAKLLRVNQLSAGGGIGTGTINAATKFDSGKDKYTASAQAMDLYAVYPTPIGLRLGIEYQQTDAKLKYKYVSITDFTAKISNDSINFTVAGAMPNGFGGALVISTNKESTTLSGDLIRSQDKDVNYGLIIPQLYYAADDWEGIFTWKPSLRHETSTKDGTYALSVEYGLSDVHPLAELTRYRNSENSGESESDHFKLDGGIRYILDRESNIRAILRLEEAYYTDRTHAGPESVALYGLAVSGEHVLQANHVLGWGVAYSQSAGKGKTLNQSTTITSDATTFVASYKFVSR